jgi:hypothetical protein
MNRINGVVRNRVDKVDRILDEYKRFNSCPRNLENARGSEITNRKVNRESSLTN